MFGISPAYLAMLIIGGSLGGLGFLGLIISFVSVFITHLSIYSKTFFIVSLILTIFGSILAVVGWFLGAEQMTSNIPNYIPSA